MFEPYHKIALQKSFGVQIAHQNYTPYTPMN